MKKNLFITTALCLLSFTLVAQLKVAENGNVGIQTTTQNPYSPLSIGGQGSSSYLVAVDGGNSRSGISVRTEAQNRLTNVLGIYSYIYSYPTTSSESTYARTALRGDTWMMYPTSHGKAYGVLGIAGNYQENYGVMGVLTGLLRGAGIVGTTQNKQSLTIDGSYAGYFDGNVKVTGLINGITVGNSDIQYKKDIVSLKKETAIGNVLKMNPVEYSLKQMYSEVQTEEGVKSEAMYDEKSQIFQKKQYGLIAQELKEIYPDLVYEQDNGYLAINYTGLIPILIQAIKELDARVQLLEGQKETVELKSILEPQLRNATDIAITNEAQVAKLYQNTPNPFSQTTQIKYFLPENVGTAYLCIYDMQGKQIKQYPLTERGENYQQISGSEFTAGMYLYALLADDTEVDVKRMILTD